MAKTRILALGNILIRDDGVGPYLLARLESEYEFPLQVDLLDGGTPGFDLLPLIEGLDCLILLDAVKGPGPPGSVHEFTREQIMASGVPTSVAAHDPKLREVLFEAALRERLPQDVLLVGVVPEDTSVGTNLSDTVLAAAPEALRRVEAKLKSLGMEAVRRQVPKPLEMWWQEEAPRA